MSTTADFFRELCQRGGDEDRAFVDAQEIASGLGMNDTDLVAVLESLELGNLIEEGVTEDIFTNPVHKQTQDYIMGRIG